MPDLVTYTAVLPVAEETVLFVSRLLAACTAHRRGAAAARPGQHGPAWTGMDDNPVHPVREYVLGSTDPEMARLAAISRVYGPMTGTWLDAAGVGPGIRVADLGCGPGEVTLAAARRVGPTGSVVGGDDA